MQEIPEIVNSIKQAAELTGLTEDTIRYYEKIGLLPYADRKRNGHRVYSRDQIRGIIFLTRLKATGMTLEEMKRYRELSSRGNDTIPLRLSILEKHKQKIQKEISRLNETEKIIEFKIDHYREISQNPDLSDSNCTPTLK
ncbi:MerR family transcriptional regulator [Cohnella thailandensis]|uniref:MerR family transcriptional regulator n=1 Tax=Cohnella thailandensis TaxID=557557 RepID=A0A841SQ01_9BACL|nr:MerR family transcriptional regulator [Cohnella thailandensis]MBB6632919.1 MerR family transcriptional regulator [Cohnella thailandensis]MBP1975388.1 DNA-binding transcriptional MerR regulator [Cohnella thailandensis]